MRRSWAQGFGAGDAELDLVLWWRQKLCDRVRPTCIGSELKISRSGKRRWCFDFAAIHSDVP